MRISFIFFLGPFCERPKKAPRLSAILCGRCVEVVKTHDDMKPLRFISQNSIHKGILSYSPLHLFSSFTISPHSPHYSRARKRNDLLKHKLVSSLWSFKSCLPLLDKRRNPNTSLSFSLSWTSGARGPVALLQHNLPQSPTPLPQLAHNLPPHCHNASTSTIMATLQQLVTAKRAFRNVEYSISLSLLNNDTLVVEVDEVPMGDKWKGQFSAKCMYLMYSFYSVSEYL